MSDVKRTLKVFGIIGCLECMLLQEISEARPEDESRLFSRDHTVLLSGQRQSARPVDIKPASERDVASDDAHNNLPALGRPTSSEAPLASISTTNRALDSFPKSSSLGSLSGRVEKLSGDMFRRDVGGKTKALKTNVLIFKGKIESNVATGQVTMPTVNDPRYLKTVPTDENGKYKTELPAGIYTVFAEIDGKLYKNVYDGEGNFSSIEIKADHKEEENIQDTSKAYF